MDTSQLRYPKGPTRKTINARKRRAESAVLRQVRREVFERDSICRLWPNGCDGRLELAHLTRRSSTRGMAPEARHKVSEAIVLCSRHHGMEERHELRWRYLTTAKANGYIAWTWHP